MRVEVIQLLGIQGVALNFLSRWGRIDTRQGLREGNLLIDEAVAGGVIQADGGLDAPVGPPPLAFRLLLGLDPQPLSGSPKTRCDRREAGQRSVGFNVVGVLGLLCHFSSQPIENMNAQPLSLSRRVLAQDQRQRGPKVYSLHAPEVE